MARIASAAQRLSERLLPYRGDGREKLSILGKEQLRPLRSFSAGTPLTCQVGSGFCDGMHEGRGG